MAQGQLIFDLNEDRSDFELAVNAHKWYAVAWDIDQELRRRTKYASDEDDDKVVEALYKLRDDFREIMTNNGVSFD
jgi:hypothetical protein